MQDRNAPDRFALIDGMRGFAALAILLFHYKNFGNAGVDVLACADCARFEPGRSWLSPLYDYGYLAVQLFWVISGFVFASAYLGRDVSAREFWVNRFARLYPLHLLTLLVVTVLQFTALARLNTTLLFGGFDLPHFLLQLGFASNWLDAGFHTFNGPIWSVSVEVLVYGLFWLGRNRLAGLGPVGFLLVLMGCLATVGLAPKSQVQACAFFFFAGVAAARLNDHLAGHPGKRGPLLAVWLAALAAMLFAPSVPLRYAASVVGIGGMLVLLAGIEPWAGTRLRRAAVWIGDCTYGLYLWHIPMQLVLLVLLLPGQGMVDLARQGWFLALWLIAMVAIARLSFLWIERPARLYLRRKWASPPPPVPA